MNLFSFFTRNNLIRHLSYLLCSIALSSMVQIAVAGTTDKPATPVAAGSLSYPDPTSVVTVAEVSSIPTPRIAARAWIAIDVNTGQVLAASYPDTKVEPASLTKIMTAYVVFNALKEKRLQLDQPIIISENAWRTGGSRMFLEPRKLVTVHELNQGMIVQSGNDASVALAEAVAGSEAAFAALMNQHAQRMQLTNTHFMNATGLTDPQHMSSVRDLATLALRLIADYPEYFHYYKQKEFTYNKITQLNRNRLLWADPSVDGMKTGHTEAAGFCLVATAKRADRRILTVMVGTDSEATRAEESLKLMNWSFQNFDLVKLFDKGQPAISTRVWGGKLESADLGPAEPIWISVPRGRSAELKPIAKYAETLFAPLEKNQKIGTLQLTLDNKVLRVESLVVREAVERAGFFGRAIDGVKRWFQ